MRLYHGTNEAFNDIELSKSRKGKDFGIGFYLTPSRKVAQDQANKKAENFGGEPIVYEYEIDDAALSELKVLRFDCNDYTMEWTQFIRSNRQNKTRQQLHDYDVVIGPIANDTVGYQIRDWKTVSYLKSNFCKRSSIITLRFSTCLVQKKH